MLEFAHKPAIGAGLSRDSLSLPHTEPAGAAGATSEMIHSLAFELVMSCFLSVGWLGLPSPVLPVFQETGSGRRRISKA